MWLFFATLKSLSKKCQAFHNDYIFWFLRHVPFPQEIFCAKQKSEKYIS
jgi:hypothetical protein